MVVDYPPLGGAVARRVDVDHAALELFDELRQRALLEAQRLAADVAHEETARVERAAHRVEVLEELLVVCNSQSAARVSEQSRKQTHASTSLLHYNWVS